MAVFTAMLALPFTLVLGIAIVEGTLDARFLIAEIGTLAGAGVAFRAWRVRSTRMTFAALGVLAVAVAIDRIFAAS